MKSRNKLFKLACPLICSVSLLSTPVFAEEDEDDFESISLEDLLNGEVVSATRSESKLSESPVPMSVITAKEIASSGLDNIPDILGRLPEIDVLHIGRSQTEVSMRGKGINFNRRLLVLIDGRTEYNDLFGVTLWHAFPISVDDIERIEVVRGPASALFGANAYSGVINIITKQADADNVRVVRAHTGQYGTTYIGAAANFKGERNSFKISFNSQDADSVDTDVPFAGFNRIPTTVNFNTDDDASLEGMQRVNMSAILSTSDDWNIHLNTGSSDGTLELFQQPGLPRDKWNVKTQNIHGIFNWFISDSSSFQFNVYQNNFKYNTGLVPTREQQEALAGPETNGFFFPVRGQDSLFSGEADTFDYSFQFVGKALDDKMAWVLGTERREIDNKGGLVLDSSRSISSDFGNFTLRMGEKWLLGLGLRMDYDSFTGKDMGYNSSIQYALNDTDNIRVTARKAFRAPSLFEMFSSVDLPVPNQNQQVNFRGNVALDVETIESFDITYTAQFGDNMQVTLEYYQEDYGSIIGNPDSGILDDVEITPEGLLISTTSFQNLANASSSGIQAGVVWIPSAELTTYANYRYADPDDLNSVAGETFFTPEHTIKFGGVWKFMDGLSVDFSYRYIGKTDEGEFAHGNVAPDGSNFTRDNQEAYNTLNLALHFQPDWVENLNLYLVIDNALDDQFVEYYEYDQILNGVGEMAGRSIWGGVSWNF